MANRFFICLALCLLIVTLPITIIPSIIIWILFDKFFLNDCAEYLIEEMSR